MISARLIEGVADSLAFRDRTDLDLSLARLLREHFDALGVTLIDVARESQGVQLHARLTDGVDSLRTLTPFELLSRIDPVLNDGETVHIPVRDGIDLTVFPVSKDLVGPRAILVTETQGALAPRDVRLVHGLLRIFGNYVAALDYGERDTLTGLLNRKTFESQFERFRSYTRRHGERPRGDGTSWLGLLDIDHFKSINDRFGHLFGDEVLLLVSQQFRRTLRVGDQLFRFGGEEFVVMLNGIEEAGARTAFERLRGVVEKHEFPQLGRVTISLGWTRVGLQDGPMSCLERADAALYYAKAQGRNRVNGHEELVAAGHLGPQAAAREIELF
ncbi:MAG: GGDEF domain-containing protein [Steroidobacteraceae bacterium]